MFRVRHRVSGRDRVRVRVRAGVRVRVRVKVSPPAHSPRGGGAPG